MTCFYKRTINIDKQIYKSILNKLNTFFVHWISLHLSSRLISLSIRWAYIFLGGSEKLMKHRPVSQKVKCEDCPYNSSISVCMHQMNSLRTDIRNLFSNAWVWIKRYQKFYHAIIYIDKEGCHFRITIFAHCTSRIIILCYLVTVSELI